MIWKAVLVFSFTAICPKSIKTAHMHFADCKRIQLAFWALKICCDVAICRSVRVQCSICFPVWICVVELCAFADNSAHSVALGKTLQTDLSVSQCRIVGSELLGDAYGWCMGFSLLCMQSALTTSSENCHSLKNGINESDYWCWWAGSVSPGLTAHP